MAASCLLLVAAILIGANAFYLPIFKYYPIIESEISRSQPYEYSVMFQNPYQPYQPYQHKKYQANYLSTPISNYQQGHAYQSHGNNYQKGYDGDDYQQNYQGNSHQQHYQGKNDQQGYPNSNYQLNKGDDYQPNYPNNNYQANYPTDNYQPNYPTDNYQPNYPNTNKYLSGGYEGDQEDTYPN